MSWNYPEGIPAAFWEHWEGTPEQQAEREAEEAEVHARLMEFRRGLPHYPPVPLDDFDPFKDEVSA